MKIMKITFLLLLSFSAFGQIKVIDKNQEYYYLGTLDTASFDAKGYVTVQIEPKSADEYTYTIMRKKKLQNWSLQAIIENDNTSAIAYSSVSPAPQGWFVNATGEAKFFASNFAWIPAPNGTQTAYTRISGKDPVRFSFWSERSTGHAPYILEVKIGTIIVQTVTIDPRQGPAGSDKDRGQPSFTSNTLNPQSPGVTTEYTLTIRPTGQMVIDRITIEALK